MRLLALILSLLLTGCITDEFHITYCRHRAVSCALVYGEIYGPEHVGIAIGPTDDPVWHAQAYVEKSGKIKWINSIGHGCELGGQERFYPQYYMTVKGFINNQFPWVR